MREIKEKIKKFYWQHGSRQIPIGMGCAWIGREASYLDTLEHDRALLHRVYQSGVRYFDTSRSYGNSEESLGAFVKEIDRNTVFIATKAKPDDSGLEGFKQKFYESFKRLNTDYIDLYQVHDTNSYNVCMEEIVPFLHARRDEGIIGAVGMGTRSQVALSQGIACGGIDSALSYLDYNLVKLSARPTIALAAKKGAAFINSSVLMFGLIKGEQRGDVLKGLAGLRAEHADAVRSLCAKMNVDIVAASLQYSLLNKDIDLTLNGIKRFSNLESTVQSMDTHIPPEFWAQLAALQESFLNIEIEDEGNY